MPWAPKRRQRGWEEVDDRRKTAAERGYDHRWRKLSAWYRRQHPLCVLCLMRGRLRRSECVDHIVPIECVPELQWEQDNWQALCWSHHSWKTTQDTKGSWTPNADRIVVCGLPGSGKTTYARRRKAPCFDPGEMGFATAEEESEARTSWLGGIGAGPCTVIVASTVVASHVAQQINGVVRHHAKVFVDRSIRN